MDLSAKLSILADAAKYDASCASSGSKRKRMAGGVGNTEGMGICHSYTPDGRCVSLLKILLTNYCIYDCQYCINRISSDIPRARMTPEEVAQLTIEFYKRNYIEGLFLSSGVRNSPDETMLELTRAAEILRQEHKFGGYIHLKAVPGAAPEILQRAARVADRLSANIELPEQEDLDRLAKGKKHPEIESTMKTLLDTTTEPRQLVLPAGQSTQMIVGATPSSDATLLHKSSELYRRFKLRRVYYTAFSPIQDADTQLPLTAPPLVREHRLYQADWLMRHYGFQAHEILEGPQDNLALDHDPKLAWALRHRDFFPVDLNHASRAALLRVPGLGARSVDRILSSRKHRRLRMDDLKHLRVSIAKAQAFLHDGQGTRELGEIESRQLLQRMQSAPQAQQLSLFTAARSALTGEL